jgi:hypothetical protein
MESRRSNGALALMAIGAAYLVALSVLFHATTWSRKSELTLVGGTLEAFGVALVSIDFWAPWLAEVARNGMRTGRAWLRWLLGVGARLGKAVTGRRDVVKETLSATATASASLGVEVISGAKGESNAALVRRIGEMDKRIGELEKVRTEVPKQIQAAMDLLSSLSGIM